MASEEQAPNIADWYPELISPIDNRELSESEQTEALDVVRMAMNGFEQALAEGKVTGVQISFEVVNPRGNIEFNFATPEE